MTPTDVTLISLALIVMLTALAWVKLRAEGWRNRQILRKYRAQQLRERYNRHERHRSLYL